MRSERVPSLWIVPSDGVAKDCTIRNHPVQGEWEEDVKTYQRVDANLRRFWMRSAQVSGLTVEEVDVMFTILCDMSGENIPQKLGVSREEAQRLRSNVEQKLGGELPF